MVSVSTGGGAGIRARAPAVVVTLFAPVLLYWICRNAALALSGAPAAYAGTALPPTDYTVTLKGLVRQSADPTFKVQPEMMELARAAAVAMPLAFEPFSIAAKAEEQAGRVDRATRLMEEARRRRPNHTAIRAQLAVYYGRSEDVANFVNEIDFVLRKSDAAKMQVLPEMAKLIDTPGGRQALAQILAGEPAWREDFYRIGGDRKLSPKNVADLVEQIRKRKGSRSMAPEQAFYVRALVSAGQIARARAVWSTLPGVPAANDSQVFDGNFLGSKAPPPFNWTFHDTELGRASVAKGTGGAPYLEVEYFGGRNVVLAEQTVALRPGRYRIELTAGADEAMKSGSLFWRIGCLPDNQEAGRLELDKVQQGNRKYQKDFTVPAGACDGQKLQLVAEAGDVSAPMNLRMSQLSIRSNG